MDQTFGCPAFDNPTYTRWRTHTLTKAESTAQILHQPRCRRCLEDPNPAEFEAYYDISTAQAERIAARYAAYYPDHAVQPFIYVRHNDLWGLSIHTHDARGEHAATADVDANSLVAKFTICTNFPYGSDRAPIPGAAWAWEQYEFDLSHRSGWEAMLRTFPQPEGRGALKA